MSEEQLKAFIAKAKDDQSIQDKLKAAKTPEDVVTIAKDHGHDDKITELSEEELEGVAGGLDGIDRFYEQNQLQEAGLLDGTH